MFRAIYEGAIFHDQADENLLAKIRDHHHYYIEWKTNLLFIMKRNFLQSNACDYSLGRKVGNGESNLTITKTFFSVL